jgi:restriction system protein
LIGLTAWLPKGLVQQIDQHNATVRKALHERLLKMPPKDFQDLVGELLTKIGFQNVVVSKYSGDGGIDARGTLVVDNVVEITMAVQVKRFKNNVQAPIVAMVRGSLGAHERGLIVTTSDFSPGARTEARDPTKAPVALVDGDDLVILLIEHGMGVRRDKYDLLELEDPVAP